MAEGTPGNNNTNENTGRTSPEQFAATIRALREALAFSPENIPLRLHLADTLRQAGQAKTAVEEYREVLQKHTLHPQALRGLGISLYQAGNYPDAVHNLQEAIRLDPQDAESLLWLAKSQREQNDITGALKNYLAAASLDPVLAEQYSDLKNLKPVPNGLNLAYPEKKRLGEKEFSVEETDRFFMERPDVSFTDIGGLTDLKEKIRLTVIYPYLHPEIYKAYGKNPGGGILLYGPPGCGKTHIARATAGECGMHFVSVGIHDIIDAYYGETEKRIHHVFEVARKFSPSVIFIDEVDALGVNRLGTREAHYRLMSNQFLAELDGINTNNLNIMVIAATNAPWQLDSAFLRPGRFDRLVFVSPPDLTARAEIFRLHVKDRPIDELDFTKLARQTEGFSGADIKGVCDRATEEALQDAMRSGKIRAITMNDFNHALKSARSSIGDWLSTAQNYYTYSNQSGLYDDIGTWLRQNRR